MRSVTIGMALVLAGTTGCVSSSKYEQKEKELAASAASAKEAADRATACDQKVAALEGQVTALDGELAEAKKQLASATEAKEQLQVQTVSLQEKSTQYEQLAGSLQSQIQAGQVEIQELRGKMTVKLKDKVLFSSGSASLNKEGREALDAVAGVFKEQTGKNVVVAGYTDDVPMGKGAFKDNWELSTARAIAVVRYLASKGVPEQMLGAAGFSQFRPIAANDSPANRSLNRRIEIALTAADWEPPMVEAK
ncbi:MAG TPA: OmpA family protein [Anaeromyxobacteraceae bacterium]|nr:OmpA family protein [Anaeromyxobacteraceae bacterium]